MSKPDRWDRAISGAGSEPGISASGPPPSYGMGSGRVPGVPEAADEYDCMISPLLHHPFEGAASGKLADWICQERLSHFGFRSDDVRDSQLAKRTQDGGTGGGPPLPDSARADQKDGRSNAYASQPPTI
jgi:hypothetical protein